MLFNYYLPFFLMICMTLFFIYVCIRGVDNVKRDFNYLLDSHTGRTTLYYEYGLSMPEAIDFIKKLDTFHQTMSLSNYEIEETTGWIIITYEISGIKWTDPQIAKRAICLELHSYILENHGIDSRAFYIPTLTTDIMILKIAISMQAVDYFKMLKFNSKKNNCNRQMLDK